MLTYDEEVALRKVAELIRKYYEAAKKKKYIRHPLTWAIYQVWKEYDRNDGND